MIRYIARHAAATAACVALVSLAGTAFAAPAPARMKNVTLHVFNRIFTSFHDKVVATPQRAFRVGDTDFSARIIRFEPDFTYDLKTRKVTSVSGEPKNPAFQIVVSKNGVPHDTSWAFFNMPPHFSARSELAFVATRIEFTNRPPLVSNDSLAIKIREREGGAR